MHSGGADRRGDAYAGRVYRRVDPRPERALAMSEKVVYIIHSADVCNDSYYTIRRMESRVRNFLGEGRLHQTEGDEAYDYNYLSEECGDDRYENGYHRKWAGLLSLEDWLKFADAYGIDLDDDGVPERYEETMGSITDLGHLPAISVDDSEGWNSGYEDGGVIDSNIYISIGEQENA